ncbi:hypothetical protein B0J14DRAFT_516764 [Halenospora varia]|nr:hypothetical protein B0J14DRAFT_516764 [Halenospora varia]
MSITLLSTEILQKIYEYTDVQDALHLAKTSKKNYRTFLGRRMPILEQTMHNSYGPLPELVKLVISNEQDKSRRPMGTEIRRNNMLDRIIQVQEHPKLTIELIKKMMEYGRVADKWAEVYPRLRWRYGSSNRRLLRATEKQRLRGAIYRQWTYTNLFHDRTYTQFAPDPPLPSSPDDPRLRLLRTYSNESLAQLSELHFHIMQLIELDLYPSNQVVLEHYSHSLPWKALEKLAWGERGNEYWRLIRVVTKFNPIDLLHLVENTSTKMQRADFLHLQGTYFTETSETLNEALRVLYYERLNELCADPARGASQQPFYASVSGARSTPQEDIEFWGGHENGIVDVSASELKDALGRRVGQDKLATTDLTLRCRGLGSLLAVSGRRISVEDG